jgi:glycosyltransferase involved in cell wall biosynthesis
VSHENREKVPGLVRLTVVPADEMEHRMKIAFVVNHVAFFVSHRLPIAIDAQRRGWSVSLLTGRPGSDEMEEEAGRTLLRSGIEHWRFCFGGGGINPFRELLGFVGLWRRLVRLRPDVLHCASPIGVLYGGLAARLAGVPSLVLAVSGMGYAFTAGRQGGLKRRLIRAVYSSFARIAFGHANKRVIVQNLDDARWLADSGLASRAEIILVPGSGVDLTQYTPSASGGRETLVVFPARLLRDKGILEFVAAARAIRQLAPEWKFVLAGAAGYRNPSSIDESTVREWVSEGIVQWLGHVQDMADLFRRASIVCLPSYREGMPKALLEAASCGCPIVTTDAVGCREAIIEGETGDLVPVGDVDALVGRLLRLISDPERRARYGVRGRLLAEQRFGLEAVLQQVFGVYDSLVEARRKH